jgi:hypothetical protein
MGAVQNQLEQLNGIENHGVLCSQLDFIFCYEFARVCNISHEQHGVVSIMGSLFTC